MKNYDKEKREIFDKINAFLNSPEIKSVIETANEIQKKIDSLPNSQFKHCDNFVNYTNAFSNMMLWCSDFTWNRNLKTFNYIFAREEQLRKIKEQLKDA